MAQQKWKGLKNIIRAYFYGDEKAIDAFRHTAVASSPYAFLVNTGCEATDDEDILLQRKAFSLEGNRAHLIATTVKNTLSKAVMFKDNLRVAKNVADEVLAFRKEEIASHLKDRYDFLYSAKSLNGQDLSAKFSELKKGKNLQKNLTEYAELKKINSSIHRLIRQPISRQDCYQFIAEPIASFIVPRIEFKNLMHEIINSLRINVDADFFQKIKSQYDVFFPDTKPLERPAAQPTNANIKSVHAYQLVKHLEEYLIRQCIQYAIRGEMVEELFIAPMTRFYSIKNYETGAKPKAHSPSRASKNHFKFPLAPLLAVPMTPRHSISENEVPISPRMKISRIPAPLLSEHQVFPAPPTYKNTLGWQSLLYLPDMLGEALFYYPAIGISLATNKTVRTLSNTIKTLATSISKMDYLSAKIAAWTFVGAPLSAIAGIGIAVAGLTKYIAAPILFGLKLVTFGISKLTSWLKNHVILRKALAKSITGNENYYKLSELEKHFGERIASMKPSLEQPPPQKELEQEASVSRQTSLYSETKLPSSKQSSPIIQPEPLPNIPVLNLSVEEKKENSDERKVMRVTLQRRGRFLLPPLTPRAAEKKEDQKAVLPEKKRNRRSRPLRITLPTIISMADSEVKKLADQLEVEKKAGAIEMTVIQEQPITTPLTNTLIH